MKPRHRVAPTLIVLAALIALITSWLLPTSNAQGQVQVTAATPSSTEQGTINLNVKVNGKGFKNGAHAQWFVTGTTDTGGVTVNSTAFVSSTELQANITVSDTAVVGTFDIQVLNSDGRGGKGTELFAVTGKGNAPTACTVQPLPSGVSLVNTLNYVTGSGTAAYGPALGIAIRARQMTLNGAQVVVVGVGTTANTGKFEIFLLDPATGQVLDNTVIGSGPAIQPHITVNTGEGSRSLAVGDVNGDSIPDFAVGSSTTDSANGLVGSISNGVLSYQSYPLLVPAPAAQVGWEVAMGDLNGNGSDVVAVGAPGSGGGQPILGKVCLYSFTGSGFQNFQNITSPLGGRKNVDTFGMGIAIADVAGSSAKDLIVGAPTSTVNGQSGAGSVYVFPGPVSASSYFTISSALKNEGLARKLAVGTVNGDAFNDLFATTAAAGRLYFGPLTSGQTSSLFLQPATNLGGGWGTTAPDVSDVNNDGLADVLIGAPNAESGPVCGGVAYLYLSASGSPASNRLMIGTPVIDSNSVQRFGWAAGFAPGTQLFFVGDQGLVVGNAAAGQVYVFKVN